MKSAARRAAYRRIGERAVQEDVVIAGERVEVAGAHAEHRARRRWGRRRREPQRARFPRRAPDRRGRRIEEALQRIDRGAVREGGAVARALEAIAPGLLPRDPALRQVVDRVDRRQVDRRPRRLRAVNLVAARAQRVEHLLKASAFDEDGGERRRLCLRPLHEDLRRSGTTGHGACRRALCLLTGIRKTGAAHGSGRKRGATPTGRKAGENCRPRRRSGVTRPGFRR